MVNQLTGRFYYSLYSKKIEFQRVNYSFKRFGNHVLRSLFHPRNLLLTRVPQFNLIGRVFPYGAGSPLAMRSQTGD